MSSTPSNSRATFAANAPMGPKLNSSVSLPRSPRSPRPRSIYDSSLSLKRIIGTTVASPPAFDSLASSRVFAYTAGAAVVVVNIEDDGNYSQRFFRARPTAVPQNTMTSGPSTPLAHDGRTRSGLALRDCAVPFSPSVPHTSLDVAEYSPKTWSSRERIKAATCISLSPDGRFLAVGETGYNPRVLIFTLQDSSSDKPLAILSEHTHGVTDCAFSPDNKYLASLGAPNDGFLYVWAINQKSGAAKLHSSNKCTSFIKQMIWLGNSIITVGTRHIKIWKVEGDEDAVLPRQKYALDGSPMPLPVQPLLKTLIGRNSLLGSLVDATFTCIAAISDSRAIVCSEKGDICLLDGQEGQKIMRVSNTGFPATCVAVDKQSRRVRIGGRAGKLKFLNLDALLSPSTPPESPLPIDEVVKSSDMAHLCAMGYAERSLVTIDSKHMIEVSELDRGDDGLCRTIPLSAHGDAVLGVRLLSENNDLDATFLTWSANGLIVFWDLDANVKASIQVAIEQGLCEDDSVNQCQVVRVSEGGQNLIVGDKMGCLKIMLSDQTCIFETRAHMSEILDIALFEDDDGSALMATCSRDKTIQLFRRTSKEWQFIQTLDEHSGSVSSLFFAENGKRLVSCSTDRTIHIRELIKRNLNGQEVLRALPVRIVTLKTTPLSMTPCLDDQEGNFVVSLLNKTVATYDLSSGRLVSSFQATDNDGSEPVVMDALVMSNSSSLIAGVSCTDKSVRIYDVSAGIFLDREWGHTAAVTDVALLEKPGSNQKTLISTGSDGTIMIWDVSSNTREGTGRVSSCYTRASSPAKDLGSVRTPLRKVLSKAELAEFQRGSAQSTPTGRNSPPRVRRKTSQYGLSGSGSSPALSVPPVPPISRRHLNSSSSEEAGTRRSARQRKEMSESDVIDPSMNHAKDLRRPSYSDSTGRPARLVKSPPKSFSEFGSLNMSTESVIRTLRAYRQKLSGSESIKAELIRELDQEIRLTVTALGGKTPDTDAISETVLTGLIDQYSNRLVSMFDEKLRLSREPSEITEHESSPIERPKTAGNPPSKQIYS